MELSSASFTELKSKIEALPNQQLKQCAKELLQLHSTGILPDGKIKKLRSMVSDLHIIETVITGEVLIRYAGAKTNNPPWLKKHNCPTSGFCDECRDEKLGN